MHFMPVAEKDLKLTAVRNSVATVSSNFVGDTPSTSGSDMSRACKFAATLFAAVF
jgi:hypothetical protein